MSSVVLQQLKNDTLANSCTNTTVPGTAANMEPLSSQHNINKQHQHYGHSQSRQFYHQHYHPQSLQEQQYFSNHRHTSPLLSQKITDTTVTTNPATPIHYGYSHRLVYKSSTFHNSKNNVQHVTGDKNVTHVPAEFLGGTTISNKNYNNNNIADGADIKVHIPLSNGAAKQYNGTCKINNNNNLIGGINSPYHHNLGVVRTCSGKIYHSPNNNENYRNNNALLAKMPPPQPHPSTMTPTVKVSTARHNNNKTMNTTPFSNVYKRRSSWKNDRSSPNGSMTSLKVPAIEKSCITASDEKLSVMTADISKCDLRTLANNKFSSSAPNVCFATTPSHHNGYITGTWTTKIRYRSDSKEKRQTCQDIERRVFGLMERFRSKSTIFRASKSGMHLTADGSVFDAISRDVWDVYCAKAQTEATYLRKLDLWKMVYLQIANVLTRFGVFLVGSTMSGLGTESSDIDMCLLVRPYLSDPRIDALGYLQAINNELQKCEFITASQIIQAKVPILKMRDTVYGFEVDLNCNNAVGIRNTHLLNCYAHLDWRVRPLVVITKVWAQANQINDARLMTISSYSLALMVIHYLQCGVTPPAIPCLHGLFPNKFNETVEIHDIDIMEDLVMPRFRSDNKQTLGELFLGLLHYYAIFDYDRYAISVREGCRLPKDECRFARAIKNDMNQWKLLCIEEPFDRTNTARSVYDPDIFERIKAVFRNSYERLNDTRQLCTLLPLSGKS